MAESIRRNRLPISAWLLVLSLMVTVHLLTVGLGYRVGSNHSWHIRIIAFLGGPVFTNLVVGLRSAAVTAMLLTVAVLSLRRFSLIPRFLGILAALALGVLVDMCVVGTNWEISVTRMLTPWGLLWPVVMYTIWLLVAWQARRDWQTVLFGLSMCFVAALPTWMAAQTQDHTRYIASFFMETAVAAALIRTARAAVLMVNSDQ